jgi:hypothetical protein
VVIVFLEVLNLLLVVENEPALGAEHLPVGFLFYVFDLEYEVFPLFAILFNHFIYYNSPIGLSLD